MARGGLQRRRTVVPDGLTTAHVALAMVVVAVAAVIVGLLGALQAWMPSVAVGALTVAITVTVVERAFRNEDRARDKPILDVISTRVDLQLSGFIYALLADYSETHLDTFNAIPATLEQLCKNWLDGIEDTPRPARPAGAFLPLIGDARALSDHLSAARAQYAFVIDKSPALVDAIERLGEWVANASGWVEREKAGFGTFPVEFQVVMLRRIVEAVLNFAHVYADEAGHELRVSDQQREAAVQWNRAGRAIAAQREGSTANEA